MNDLERLVAKRAPSADVGPGRRIRHCCFNNTFKITPLVFDVWRGCYAERGQRAVGSGGNPTLEANLGGKSPHAESNRSDCICRAGAVRGLPVSTRRPFSDTLPFNGGATASDALRAGTPVLTCAGEALRLGWQAASSTRSGCRSSYLCSTSTKRARRTGDGARVAGGSQAETGVHRQSHPCSMDRFRRHFEAARAEMWTRCQRGEAPAS